MQTILMIQKLRLPSSVQSCIMMFIAALALLLLLLTTVQADNFIVTQYPTSDPAPSVFTYNGETRVYLYCTQDKMISSGSYPIDTLHCYSSNDMFHWRDEGVALDERSCGSWANRGAHQLWAPTVVFYKGKYRLFVSAVDQSGTGDASARVFSATADSPKGPFIPSTNPPFLSTISIGSIDPFCYIDTLSTGAAQAYLVLRNGKSGTSISMARLNDDATDVVGTPWVVRTLPTTGYKEGTWVFKRNGFYYLIYATTNGTPRETIEYATAPVPAQGGISETTAWTHRGLLIGMNSNQWTIHSGACNFQPKGATAAKWYVCWHGVQEPEIGGNRLFSGGQGRCTGFEEISFSGTNPPLINTVTKTARGVGICLATDSIQVDRYNSASGCVVTTIQHPGSSAAPTGWFVSNIANNATLTYNNVDFTPTAGYDIATVVANVASSNATGTIRISAGSTVLGTIAVPNTGGTSTWQITTPLTLATKPAAGVQNLTLTFTTSSTGSFNVNWVRFSEKQKPIGIQQTSTELNLTGLSYVRANNNTFSVKNTGGATLAGVRLFNLRGKEIADAYSTNFVGSNLVLSVKPGKLATGSYFFTVKCAMGELRIPFVY